MRLGYSPMTSVLTRQGKVGQKHTHTREKDHVQTAADIRMIQLKNKKHQELLRATRN